MLPLQLLSLSLLLLQLCSHGRCHYCRCCRHWCRCCHCCFCYTVDVVIVATVIVVGIVVVIAIADVVVAIGVVVIFVIAVVATFEIQSGQKKLFSILIKNVTLGKYQLSAPIYHQPKNSLFPDFLSF